MASKREIILYGNVGGDPETRTLPAKEVAKSYYDPIVDEVVERQYTTSDREVRSFSIAVSKKDPEGGDVPDGSAATTGTSTPAWWPRATG
jgi:single-stranded DNA-binding protein